MALKKCPDCGNEISDLAPYCLHCGFPFEGSIKRNKKKHKTGIFVGIVVGSICIILAIAILTVFLIFFGVKNRNYKIAGELYANEQYIEAAKKYSSLGNYKKSYELKNDSYYKAGKEYALAGQYDDAIACFEKTGDYLDSLEQIKAIEDKVEKETIHKEAVDKLKDAYDACRYGKARLSYDGESITVDSDDEYDGEALLDIITITAYLDMPDSIIDDFSYTNALMGRQTKKYGNYEVSWSYHPKNGLDVTFVVDTD